MRAQSESIEYGKRSVSIHFFSLGLWSVFMTLLARKIILAFTKLRDVQFQKCLRMKKIFATCRNPKPSVVRRCTLSAVARTQGTPFSQGEDDDDGGAVVVVDGDGGDGEGGTMMLVVVAFLTFPP